MIKWLGSQLRAIWYLFSTMVFRSPRTLMQRDLCWHHDAADGTSFIESALVDIGRTKVFWCTRCQQTWTLNDLLFRDPLE